MPTCFAHTPCLAWCPPVPMEAAALFPFSVGITVVFYSSGRDTLVAALQWLPLMETQGPPCLARACPAGRVSPAGPVLGVCWMN